MKEWSARLPYKVFYITILFIGLSLLFIYPFAKTNTIFFSDDMYYHLQRITELVKNYQTGNYFVGIYTNTFGKIGYPLNLFYPWITLLPFVILCETIKDQVWAIYLGIAFYTFLTLCFTYVTTKKFGKDRTQAVFTAIIYTFCSYRTVNIFTRFALGEFLALTFLPLCVYGMYAVIKGNYKEWPFLAFGMSFVLLSHILSAFLYSFFLLILLILAIVNSTIQEKRARVINMIKAIIVAVLSSAIFLFPFLEQELHQKFSQPSKVDMVTQALIPTQFLNASLNNDITRVETGNSYNIGIILLIILIIGAFQFRKWRKEYRLLYCLSLCLLIFTTSLVPWFIIQKSPISLIQFPWRLLGIVSYLLSIVGGYEIKNLISNKKRILKVVIIILILMPWVASTNLLKRDMVDKNNIHYNYIVYKENKFFYSKYAKSRIIPLYYLDQYSPKGSKKSLDFIIRHNSLVNGKVVKPKIKYSSNTIEYSSPKFVNHSNIVLPNYDYKNIEVLNDRNRKVKTKRLNDNRLEVVEKVGSPLLRLKYKVSTFNAFAVLISVLTWFAGTVAFFLKKLSIKGSLK